MSKEFLYVTQSNEITGEETLLGYNLTEEEKDKLFYSLGKRKDSSNGHEDSKDEHLSNGYGRHLKKFKNDKEAQTELMDKPKVFNDALAVLNKAGYDVVKRGVVGKNVKVLSYQMEKREIF